MNFRLFEPRTNVVFHRARLFAQNCHTILIDFTVLFGVRWSLANAGDLARSFTSHSSVHIHNPNYKHVPLRKKFLVLVNQINPQNPLIVREPAQIEPTKIMTMTLGPDFATMDDCNNLWTLTYPNVPLPSPMPVFIGYLVVLSPLELDIDVVYTANTPGDLATTPDSVSIDVERVTGKRVFVPFGALPN